MNHHRKPNLQKVKVKGKTGGTSIENEALHACYNNKIVCPGSKDHVIPLVPGN